MKVRAIVNYYDLSLKRLVEAGEEFETGDDRAKAISSVHNAAGIPLVKIVDATPTTEKKVETADKTPVAKKRTTKKKMEVAE